MNDYNMDEEPAWRKLRTINYIIINILLDFFVYIEAIKSFG